MRNPDSSIYSACAWVGVVVLAVATVAAAIRNGPWNALPPGGFLVALIGTLLWADTPPRAVMAVASWAATFNAAGWTWSLYRHISWYDEIGHAVGTLAMTLFLTCYLYRTLIPRWSCEMIAVSAAVFSLGVALGAFWELAEWTGYYLFGRNPERIFDDILSDLIFDSAGALAAVPLGYWANGSRRQEVADISTEKDR